MNNAEITPVNLRELADSLTFTVHASQDTCLKVAWALYRTAARLEILEKVVKDYGIQPL